MSPSAQAKFLRVLRSGSSKRLGGTRLQRATVRIIAADQPRPAESRRARRFSARTSFTGCTCSTSAWPRFASAGRHRAAERRILQEIAKSFGRPPAGLTRDAREALLQHDWPEMCASCGTRSSAPRFCARRADSAPTPVAERAAASGPAGDGPSERGRARHDRGQCCANAAEQVPGGKRLVCPARSVTCACEVRPRATVRVAFAFRISSSQEHDAKLLP